MLFVVGCASKTVEPYKSCDENAKNLSGKYRFLSYEESFNDRLMEVRNSNKYIEKLKNNNYSGSVSLAVSLSKTGRIKEIRIKNSTNIEIEKLAKELLYDASPFDKFIDHFPYCYDEIVIPRTVIVEHGNILFQK